MTTFNSEQEVQNWLSEQLTHIIEEGYGYDLYICQLDESLFATEQKVRNHIKGDHDAEPVSKEETVNGWDEGEYKSTNYEQIHLFDGDVVEGLAVSIYKRVNEE